MVCSGAVLLRLLLGDGGGDTTHTSPPVTDEDVGESSACVIPRPPSRFPPPHPCPSLMLSYSLHKPLLSHG